MLNYMQGKDNIGAFDRSTSFRKDALFILSNIFACLQLY